jgi:hypothetical protein
MTLPEGLWPCSVFGIHTILGALLPLTVVQCFDLSVPDSPTSCRSWGPLRLIEGSLDEHQSATGNMGGTGRALRRTGYGLAKVADLNPLRRCTHRQQLPLNFVEVTTALLLRNPYFSPLCRLTLPIQWPADSCARRNIVSVLSSARVLCPATLRHGSGGKQEVASHATAADRFPDQDTYLESRPRRSFAMTTSISAAMPGTPTS